MPASARRTVLLSALLGLVVACEDPSPSEQQSTAPSNTLTRAQFAAEFSNLMCQNLQRCCSTLNLGFDATLCSSAFADAGQGSDSSGFNPANAAQCLANIRQQQGCNTQVNPAPCSLVYSDAASALATPCTVHADCIAPAGQAASCDQLTQTCAFWLRGRPYESCQRSCEQRSNGAIACVWGSASSPPADDSTIVNCFANDGLICGSNGQCMALGKTGEPCVTDDECERSLYCATSTTAGPASCQPRRAVGQSCIDYQIPCVRGAFCSAGSCVARKSNGQSCLASSECLGICYCGDSGDCSTNGRCVDPNTITNAWTLAAVAVNYCAASD